jgi:hypothetical protein
LTHGGDESWLLRRFAGGAFAMKIHPTGTAFAIVLSLWGSSAEATGPASSAIAGIAGQFDHYSIVLLGEMHRSLQIHTFIQQMLHDPRFICRTDDVVFEFGNSHLQKLADIYAAGGALSETEIQSMWRETAVPLTWNAPVYRAVYDTIRDINRARLCSHPVRIVLADAPLDWSKISSVKDLLPFADRDTAMADVVERQVIGNHHHAFMITGEFHAEKRTDEVAEGLRTAEIIERRHPHALFSIVTVAAPAAAVLHMGPAPSFRPVRGSDLEDRPFAMTNPDWSGAQQHSEKSGLRMGDVVDGLLYVGGDSSLFPSPTIYLDPAYARELRRRCAIIREETGQDFVAVVNDLVREGRDQEALSHPAQPQAKTNKR